jgi:hypothetical protein
MVIKGMQPGTPSYEPFTPQPIFEVARFNVTITEDGDYYIAVYGQEGGKYSLAPGFVEQFTPAEWILIPYSVIAIHLWEGQTLAEVLAPMIIVVLGGLILIFLIRNRPGTRPDITGGIINLSGLLYLGGGSVTAAQIVHSAQVTGYSPAILVTLIFVAAPAILGIMALRIGLKSPMPRLDRRSGIWMIVIGLLGFMVWAGLIIGPVFAVSGGVIVLVKYRGKKSLV